MSHIRYDVWRADDAQVTAHPQQVMRELGITYQVAVPQSIADEWWFFNCQGLPDPLPPYLSELSVNPHDVVGFGLSLEEADAIARGDT